MKPVLSVVLLQPLRWCCVDCVIHHERDVREEQHRWYMWREQAITELSWHVNSIVACWHSAKLCAYAARDFRSQQYAVLPLLFFSLGLGFFYFIWGSGVFIEYLGFFKLWSNFWNICWFTVFSIQEYNNFIGILCRVSSQCTVRLSRAKLNQIVLNFQIH